MIRKSLFTVTFFVLLTFGVAILNSCFPSCTSPPFNEVSNFVAMPLELTGTNPSGENFEIATYTTQTLRYDSIAIELTYDLTELSTIDQPLSLLKSALACDPIPPYDEIQSLAVYSDRDYNQAHPAGTDLSDIIFYSLDLKTDTQDNHYFFSLWGDPVLMTFTEAPDQNLDHSFTIEIELWKSGDFTIQTSLISIKP